MAMSDVFKISASAMTAQSQRLNVVASNLANADTVGTADSVYRAKQVVFQAANLGTGVGTSATGVRVTGVVQDASEPRRVYSPKHPQADADGYISLPNVNAVEEMVNMISASRSYQNNVEVMNTAKTLMQKALTLGN